MSQGQFIERFSAIYENAAWVAERVWAKGISSEENTVQALHTAMVNVVNSADVVLK